MKNGCAAPCFVYVFIQFWSKFLFRVRNEFQELLASEIYVWVDISQSTEMLYVRLEVFSTPPSYTVVPISTYFIKFNLSSQNSINCSFSSSPQFNTVTTVRAKPLSLGAQTLNGLPHSNVISVLNKLVLIGRMIGVLINLIEKGLAAIITEKASFKP